MRALFFILVLLVAAFIFVSKRAATPAESPKNEPSAAAAASIATLPAPPPAEALNEAAYASYGMPALHAGWDSKALQQVTIALINIGQNRPRALPGPDTDYGKAFFTKLAQTTKRFHLLSPENKVATYNAFTRIFPAFSIGRSDGRPRDRELALLTGLEFELIAGFSEDPSFIKDVSARKARSMQDLDGNILIATASNIHFIGQTATIAQDVEQRLKMIGDTAAFRPEARALALSRISLHLPTIVRRLGLTHIRPILETNRTKEPDLQVREYYNALLLRIP